MNHFGWVIFCAVLSSVYGSCDDRQLPLVLPTIEEVLHYPPTAKYQRSWHSIKIRSVHPISAAWGLQRENGDELRNVVARDNDPNYVTTRQDNGDVSNFVFKPLNGSHSLIIFENLWFGMKVNYGCHVIHVDLHFGKDFGGNTTSPQDLGKIISLPSSDNFVIGGESRTFDLHVTKVDGAESIVIFESLADIIKGTKIEYELRPSYVRLQNYTHDFDSDNKTITKYEYTMNPVIEENIGLNRFFYNVKYYGDGTVRDAFIGVLFNLRDKSDSAPAVGVSPCFSRSKKTYHRGWPIIPRVRGYQACTLFQVHGKPAPEVAVAVMNSAFDNVEGMINDVFAPGFNQVGAYAKLILLTVPPTTEEKWAVAAVKNNYKTLNVRVKIPAITRTTIEVSQETFFSEHGRRVNLTCSYTGDRIQHFNIYESIHMYIPPNGTASRPGLDIVRHWEPLTTTAGKSRTTLIMVLPNAHNMTIIGRAGLKFFCAAVGRYDMAIQYFSVV